MELLDKKGRTEAEFLAAYDKNRYEKPSVAADLVVFSEDKNPAGEDALSVLLIRRGGHPFLGKYALPGGFIEPTETAEAAAVRELREETGVEHVQPQLLNVYSEPDRDPRMRVMSLAYVAMVDRASVQVKAGDDAAAAGWFHITMELAAKAEEKAEKEAETKAEKKSGQRIRYRLCLKREQIHLEAELECSRAPGFPEEQVECKILASEGLAFDHAKILAEAYGKCFGLLEKEKIFY